MNILIVDDEYYIVQGIISDVNWNKIGIDSIDTAFSMKQAQKVFEEKRIDILLTDIEMPNGSGLDLIAWAKDQNYHPVSLILTGHQSFDYAQKAIKIHCFGYILKPITPSTLEQELLSAVNAVHIDDMELESPPSDFMLSVKKFIMQNLGNEDLNRSSIAAHIHMNPDYLSYLFHKEAGHSLTTYILQERMALAQKLLITTNMTLQEVGECTGFSSTSYFHKQFKRTHGITPQQYRSMHTL